MDLKPAYLILRSTRATTHCRAECKVFVCSIRTKLLGNERDDNANRCRSTSSPKRGVVTDQASDHIRQRAVGGFEDANIPSPCADAVDRYLDEVQSAIAAIDRGAVRKIVDALEAVWLRGATTFLIGNGGSASTASHMMNDLNKFTATPGRRRFRSLALTDNVPLLTAISNDGDFADVFIEPLQTFARSGDALVAISGSGNSPNVIRAVEYALRYGMTTIGLCGDPGGRLALIAHYAVIVPANCIGQQEDGHLVLNHAIATALRERLERSEKNLLHDSLVP